MDILKIINIICETMIIASVLPLSTITILHLPDNTHDATLTFIGVLLCLWFVGDIERDRSK